MLFLIENNKEIISCEISDTKGRIIRSNLNPKNSIDISSLSQGLYVLRIVDNLDNVDIIKFQKIK